MNPEHLSYAQALLSEVRSMAISILLTLLVIITTSFCVMVGAVMGILFIKLVLGVIL